MGTPLFTLTGLFTFTFTLMGAVELEFIIGFAIEETAGVATRPLS
jgi:hypothetical protein